MNLGLNERREVLDLKRALHDLAMHRPVFHSEADLQHALAWELHVHNPTARIRPERPCEGPWGRIYIDIWARDATQTLGVELKYKTRYFRTTSDEDTYDLRSQSAQDVARYDFLADIMRLEGLIRTGGIDRGIGIFVTNDPGYWRDSGRRGRADEAFRIDEGRVINGTRAWASHAAKGTTRTREKAVVLDGEYPMRWCQYSRVDGEEFRYLLTEVRGENAGR